jgi:LydA holin phage, holin superfamily III
VTTEKDAADIAKGVLDYGWATYAWVVLLSTWGGVASFVNKVRTGVVRPFNVAELVGEIAVSGFVGVLTFWLCQESGFSEVLSAVCIGVSSHMGTRGLFRLEQFVSKKFGLDPAPPGT